MNIEHRKYPIGRDAQLPFTPENKLSALKVVADFPQEMRAAVANMSKDDLDTPYREGGWTKRQVVHHCADSHMNAYIRFKLALTEDNPNIKAYDEAAWAELQDYQAPIEMSLKLLDVLHLRWSIVLENMSDEDFDRTYYHPEKNAESKLSENLLHYEWHCRHHLAHVMS